MAVVNRKEGRRPKHYTLTLSDGQEVNLRAVRGGQTVGAARELERVQTDLAVITGRIQHIKQEAIQAKDDKEYQSKRRYLHKFEESLGDMEPQVDRMLLATVTEWDDVFLTEEDEAAGITVPLTEEGLASMERDFKFSIFNSIMDKFKEDAEEKKESGESLISNGAPATASSEDAQSVQ